MVTGRVEDDILFRNNANFHLFPTAKIKNEQTRIINSVNK